MMFNTVGAGGHDSNTYEGLKKHVVALKQKQQETRNFQHNFKEVETAAVLELKQQYELLVKHHQLQAHTLQQQLKQHVERSAKLRQRYEREKRALADELEACKRELAAKDSKLDEQLTEQRRTYEAQIESLKRNIETLENLRVADRKEAEAAQEAAISELDQFATGEIEAVKILSERRTNKLAEEIAKWKRKHKKVLEELNSENVSSAMLEQEVRELKTKNHELQVELERQQEQHGNALKHKDAKLQHYQSQLEAQQRSTELLRVQFNDELSKHKERRLRELQQIEQKMQHVIGKKDNTVKVLKNELQVLHKRLHGLEVMLEPA